MPTLPKRYFKLDAGTGAYVETVEQDPDRLMSKSDADRIFTRNAILSFFIGTGVLYCWRNCVKPTRGKKGTS